ncbi:TetR/AcrR family transcriptional regulator [Streptosporangium sp. NPDC004379]|uniref:TetR/AcrR family transcriptional regulator n=1 Tax=Streptosporangium sp. NPDC004379 TaxID=3366189 RepID=UPI0036BC115D
MARSDTKTRIQRVARELFIAQGVQQTSLQDIADRLGITKPALYYHFASREELVRSIVEPMMREGEAFIAEQEAAGPADPAELLAAYFDLHYRHREVVTLMIRELPALADLGMVDMIFQWRERLAVLLVGPSPALERQIGATVALGGLADCAVQFAHLAAEEVRPAAVASAVAALGTA